MAIGKIYQMSTSFTDYSYIINGVGGIGKTTIASELGKVATGSNKGTLVLTIGSENVPTHIDGLYGDIVPDFPTLNKFARELIKDRDTEYKDTKFICLDSLDELFRIAENYVVMEYNNTPVGKEKPAKSISGAYGGYQKGENRVIDLVIKIYDSLKKAGYQIILIGHTKVKNVTDTLTGIVYETLTCNLDNKYYTALKDKVNLVATCYNEKEITDIKQEKNAFSKTIQNKGKLVATKRVIIFRDDDNAIDMKSHFPHIVNKIDFSAEGFIKAVEDALIKKKNGDKVEIQPYLRVETTPTEDKNIDYSPFNEIEETETFEDVEEVVEESTVEEVKTETIDGKELCKEVAMKLKSADKDTKIKVKGILDTYGVKLPTENIEVLNEILKLF